MSKVEQSHTAIAVPPTPAEQCAYAWLVRYKNANTRKGYERNGAQRNTDGISVYQYAHRGDASSQAREARDPYRNQYGALTSDRRLQHETEHDRRPVASSRQERRLLALDGLSQHLRLRADGARRPFLPCASARLGRHEWPHPRRPCGLSQVRRTSLLSSLSPVPGNASGEQRRHEGQGPSAGRAGARERRREVDRRTGANHQSETCRRRGYVPAVSRGVRRALADHRSHLSASGVPQHRLTSSLDRNAAWAVSARVAGE